MRKTLFEGIVLSLSVVGIVACSTVAAPAIVQVALDQISVLANELDGQQVQTTGFVFMNNDSREVVSSLDPDNNFCVGLLVTEEEFQTLKRYDGKRATVTGIFDKEGCGGLRICHDSCGPYTLSRPKISDQ
jgi:hypothetical protein